MRKVFCALVLCAAACGGSRSEGSAPASRDGGVAARSDGGAGDPRVASGAAAFTKYCALCHGKDARGYVADNAPSLVTSTFLASADDNFLARSIELGRPGTSMAAYGRDLNGPLGDADIAAIVAFLRAQGPSLRTLDAWPGGSPDHGRAVYADNCLKCHGDQTTRGTAPHLANSTFQALASPQFLRYAIASGRPGTPMEAWSQKLAPGDIDDVVAYVRTWAQAVPPPPPPPPDQPVENGPAVLNPGGKAPTFTMKEDKYVPGDEVLAALKQKRKLVIIDARPPSDWQREHIPGAISVPYYAPDGLSRVPNDGTWVIAYCACPHHASGVIVDELRKRNYKNTAVLDEGILWWWQQGYPIEGTEAGKPPPPKTLPPPPTP